MLEKITRINILMTFIIVLMVGNFLQAISTETLKNFSSSTTNRNSFKYLNETVKSRRTLPNKNIDDCVCKEDIHKYRSRLFSNFWSYSKIEQYLKNLAKNYPKRAQLRVLGQTYENRTIYALKIGIQIDGNNMIFVTAGMHAKEWNGIMMALYIIHVLVECNLYEKIAFIDWIIIPVLNPDGYVYSFTNPKHRMWIKNRKPCSKNITCEEEQDCGVNIDKNFQYMFPVGVGSSRNPCSDFYPGIKDGTEAESYIAMDFLSSHKNRIKLYVALRTYGSLIVYPFAAGVEMVVDNPDEMEFVAKLAVDAINKHSSMNTYSYGSYASTIVPECGASMDYVKGTLKVPYVYYIHLRGFHQPPANQILPIIREAFNGICAMVKHIISIYPPPKKFLRERKGLRRRRRRRNSSQRDTFCYVMFGPIIGLYYYIK